MKRTKNLAELGQRSCETYAERPMLGSKKDGVWRWITYRRFGELVAAVRAGLAGLGVKAGDRVAFIGDNCVEWAAAAYATYGLGASFVPMYQAQRPSEWQFILADCGARVAFVVREDSFEALQKLRGSLPDLAHLVGIARPAGEADSWPALIAAGAARPVQAASPEPGDIAGFIYTSGTTGKPKGVLLSHENILSNITAVHEIFTLTPDDRSLSFLPWAHSFGQTVELHMMVSFGGSIAINDELPRLLDNLAEVKPTVLVAVPRIFNRLYGAVNQEIARRPGFLKNVIYGGVEGAIKKARGEKVGVLERLELAFDESAVFHRIRERFGGQLRFVFSGSATLSKDVAEFINALGLTVYEGYGLTETSPIVTTNSPGGRRFGTVGRALPGVRVDIDTGVTGQPREGEIVVHGPNVMIGYHHRPEENQQAFTPDGGLRTGDLGYVDEEGYLHITGRIKEQYKLENGKYVMPSPLEEALKLSPYIANVMLYGDGKPFNVALVVPDEGALRAWAEAEGIALETDVARDTRVRALLAGELARLGADLKSFERPRDFAIVSEDFTVANGLLTPTLKLKRPDVVVRHAAAIEELYARRRGAEAAPTAPM